MRLEVCGGIASGKTTFGELAQQAGIPAVFENFQENPFWRPFYTNPGKYVFETEITFLLQHYHVIKTKAERESVFICDFSPLLDLAYGKIGLRGNRLHVFESVHQELVSEIHEPDVLIHLRCDAQTELERIRKRGRDAEKSVSAGFLAELNAAIQAEVQNRPTSTRVITIDSAKEDFALDCLTRERFTKVIRELIA